MLLLLGVTMLQAAEQTPIKDIRGILSREEFNRSGLNKLSEQELLELSGNLYGWKNIPVEVKKTTPEKVTVIQEEAFGGETVRVKKSDQSPAKPTSIRTRIVGDFKGWNGKTRFILENGQVWKQTDKKKFYLKRTNPEVEIRKGVLGGYFFSLIGSGSKCKVQRVK